MILICFTICYGLTVDLGSFTQSIWPIGYLRDPIAIQSQPYTKFPAEPMDADDDKQTHCFAVN